MSLTNIVLLTKLLKGILKVAWLIFLLLFTIGRLVICIYIQVSMQKTLIGPLPFYNPVVVVREEILVILYKTPIIVANVDWFKTKFAAFVKIW